MNQSRVSPTNQTNETEFKEYERSSISVNVMIHFFLIAYFLSWLVALIYKYYDKLEPIHIFLLNCLVDYTIAMLVNIGIHVENKFINNIYSCAVMDFLRFWANISILLGFCAPEINRFLALYWNLLYNERVNNTRAIVVVVLTKFSAFCLQLISSLFEESFLECPNVPYPFLRLKDSYLLLFVRLTYILVTVSTSAYVFHVAKKVKNSVIPINLNPQETEEPQETLDSYLVKMTKIGVKVNILSLSMMAGSIPNLIGQIVLLGVSTYSHSLIVAMQLLLVISGIVILCVPILISQKLRHFSQSH